MADTKELDAAPEVSTFEPNTTTTDNLNLPRGWMYRQRRIGSTVLPWYASPRIQLLMVSMVCFLCPGMFNALGGLGGGGKADATLADNMVSPLLSDSSRDPATCMTPYGHTNKTTPSPRRLDPKNT